MAEERGLQGQTDEIRALRERVAALERQLSRYRVTGESDALSTTQETVAERAAATFFEQPLVMLIIADLVEGRFLGVNQKVCDVLGYSEKGILESSFLDRIHPHDHLKTMLEIERLAAWEQTRAFRNRHLDSQGNCRTFEWTGVVDTHRELRYAMAILVDE